MSDVINDRGSFTSSISILLLGVMNLPCTKYGVSSTDPVKVEI